MPLPAQRSAGDSSHDLTAVVATLTHRLGELGNTIESLRGMVVVNREYTQGLKSLVPTVYGVDRAIRMFRNSLERAARAASAGAGVRGLGPGASKAMEKFLSATEKSVVVLAGLASAMDRMVGAASPDVWSTLTGSLQLVAAAIGTMLLPYIVKFIINLQSFYVWLRNLSPATKDLIAKLILIATGIAALTVSAFGFMTALRILAPALKFVVGILSLLGPVLFTLSRYAVTSMVSLISSLGLFGAAAVGIAVMLIAIADELSQRADRMNKSMADQQAGHNKAISQAREGVVYENIMQQPIGQRQEYADQYVKEAEKRRDQMRNQVEAAKVEQVKARDENWFGENDYEEDVARSARMNAEVRLHNAEKLVTGTRAARDAAMQDTQKGGGSKGGWIAGGVARMRAASKKESEGEGGLMGMLLSLQTQGQPQFGQIDDVYRKVQTSALKDNTLELEIKKIWNENRQYLLEQVGLQKQIAQNTGKQVTTN